ncbi:MAG TPA: hypothetical protein VKY74_20215, partial [Chloroflexia bacterium]|nr:hypothetical protein [Chloroflexia bacterium]
MKRRHLTGLLVLAALALLAGRSGSSRAAPPLALAPRPAGRAPLVPLLIANPLQPIHPHSGPAPVTLRTLPDQTIDLGPLGIRPIAVPLAPQNSKSAPRPGLARLLPNGGALGTQNAFMGVDPDVVSQSTTSAIGTLLSSFTPNEPIAYYVNGTLAGTFAANADGRLGVSLSPGPGLGYLTMEGIGATSGKRAGGVAYVLDAAPPVPGVAAGPHANNPTGSGTGTFNLRGNRWIAGTSINIARNGVLLGTVTSSAAGTFNTALTLAAGADTSAVYSAYTSTGLSLAGISVEERADAGTPPQGDQNLARAFVDRAVIPLAGSAAVGEVGEGFQPGETVNLSGCTTGSQTASANGAVAFFIDYTGVGTGTSQCVYTGASSGRVARATVQGDIKARNAPSAITAPATLTTLATDFLFLFDRLLPNQVGTVYVDGTSQGLTTIDATGSGAVGVSAAGLAVGSHAVIFVGTSGQVALAPLYVIPASETATPTNTVVPTATAAATATAIATATATTPATATATATRTSTATATGVAGTATATPCWGPNAIGNGGFETGSLAPWVAAGGNPDPTVATAQVHTGTYAALLGTLSGGEPTGDSMLYQALTVPAGGGTLSYWYFPLTTDTISFDWQDAYIADASGTILATIMHVCQNDGVWKHVTFDMAPYAGQMVRVEFLVHQDGFGDLTAMYVDDVTLQLALACGSATATATGTPPTSTPTAT